MRVFLFILKVLAFWVVFPLWWLAFKLGAPLRCPGGRTRWKAGVGFHCGTCRGPVVGHP